MPDGQLIGRIAPGQAADASGTGQPEIRIVLNWTEELKRLVPVKCLAATPAPTAAPVEIYEVK
jgi:hypothetical protein